MADVQQVAAWLKDFVRGFNFHRKGVDKSLGRDLCNVVAWHLAERSADQKDPDGGRWPSNKDARYRREKSVNYGWDENDPPTNYRTGQMLGFVSLLGNPDIGEHEIEMRYGQDTGPRGVSWSPRDSRTQAQKEKDDSVTDVQKAKWAHEQGREFYGADDETESRVIEAAAEALETYLREEG